MAVLPALGTLLFPIRVLLLLGRNGFSLRTSSRMGKLHELWHVGLHHIKGRDPMHWINLLAKDALAAQAAARQASLEAQATGWDPPRPVGAPEAALDCGEAVAPEYCVAFDRSPQAVHTAVLPHLRGKDIVEIGTGGGDGMNCFARVARSAVAVELDGEQCAVLERRAGELAASGAGNYTVLCDSYSNVIVDADVFITWAGLALTDFNNDAILRYLRRQQAQGLVRASAEFVVHFDPALPLDRFYWHKYQGLFAWQELAPFDERGVCVNVDHPMYTARLSGVFLAAGFPLSAVPLEPL